MSAPFTLEQEMRIGEMIADALVKKAAEESDQRFNVIEAFRQLSSTADGALLTFSAAKPIPGSDGGSAL